MLQKLKAAVKKIGWKKKEHEFKQTLTVDIYYPDHPPRTESSTYRASHRYLIKTLDLPCEVCGSKENRETHHMFCEWADAEAVDWNKMKRLHPDFNWEQFKDPEDFVDSTYNLVVLCMDHHRGKDKGIHMLPYPIWQAQKFLRDDFVFEPGETPKT